MHPRPETVKKPNQCSFAFAISKRIWELSIQGEHDEPFPQQHLNISIMTNVWIGCGGKKNSRPEVITTSLDPEYLHNASLSVHSLTQKAGAAPP
ncbi:hypothetical protein L873DRAFT_1801705 [Choiromyces venosus 120613-1]|uniref:Uncharacterized protein n=1 Tax=Choiromyces venosus 120613-1 TaxID=1336337 RepID=A0A3N4JWY0_9PEZI|nr:hypothetical protein L873DRAFT_1801705 [Choiromyces venosus 120613-1]